MSRAILLPIEINTAGPSIKREDDELYSLRIRQFRAPNAVAQRAPMVTRLKHCEVEATQTVTATRGFGSQVSDSPEGSLLAAIRRENQINQEKSE